MREACGSSYQKSPLLIVVQLLARGPSRSDGFGAWRGTTCRRRRMLDTADCFVGRYYAIGCRKDDAKTHTLPCRGPGGRQSRSNTYTPICSKHPRALPHVHWHRGDEPDRHSQEEGHPGAALVDVVSKRGQQQLKNNDNLKSGSILIDFTV